MRKLEFCYRHGIMWELWSIPLCFNTQQTTITIHQIATNIQIIHYQLHAEHSGCELRFQNLRSFLLQEAVCGFHKPQRYQAAQSQAPLRDFVRELLSYGV